ncbi:MAG: hypothetical protein A4E52_01567 [Pelotomaculum sp. PtaB.Bin013]|nr:MAG: hypothetical protein A4E52_01567 [Pelotomaculum sp. PtaB.Bin013]
MDPDPSSLKNGVLSNLGLFIVKGSFSITYQTHLVIFN